ncbi:uncharacterized protein LOC110446267 [Mizuhopecten yessoensis]|uniref:Transmembrane protein n=1 Tax=Mizuhopecten yessoensis TaxID=6573 RepID=A0A210R673_MIZYE|nr:uncharacterized protein LOC110446267 [Mizuhopecten yessoensis]OWF56549.1 hypothetical protein KP79_PYT12025 [Mizuhopecten yessoensis]
MVHAGYNTSIYNESKDGHNEGRRETTRHHCVDEEDEEDEPEARLCCLGGCLTGCSLCLLLVIIFPAGILLSIYATSNKQYDVLAAGIILVVFPLITIPIVIAVYLNRRRIMRIRNQKVTDGECKGNASKY